MYQKYGINLGYYSASNLQPSWQRSLML